MDLKGFGRSVGQVERPKKIGGKTVDRAVVQLHKMLRGKGLSGRCANTLLDAVGVGNRNSPISAGRIYHTLKSLRPAA